MVRKDLARSDPNYSGGDRVELKDALGQTILDFRFEDNWYPRTDGNGYSLEAAHIWTSAPDQFSDITAWRQSVHFNGSPGVIPGY